MLLTKAELALGKLASKEESRYALNAIAVTATETQVTNGHYAVRVKHSGHERENWPVGKVPVEFATVNGRPILLDGNVAAKASVAISKKVTIPILSVAALATDGTLHVNPLDEPPLTFDAKSNAETGFPNLDAVMPAGEPKVRIGLDAKYVRMLAEYFERNGDARSAVIELNVYDAERSVMLRGRTAGGEEIVALLMPRRI